MAEESEERQEHKEPKPKRKAQSDNYWHRLRDQFSGARKGVLRRAERRVRSVIDLPFDEQLEEAFERAKERLAPDDPGRVVHDFKLRRHPLLRRIYEEVLPISHIFRITHKYGREFLDDFMPLSANAFLGRGSYKFVYMLPWHAVVKVSKKIYPSDPICGSMFREVEAAPEKFLTVEELALLEFLSRNRLEWQRERLQFKFWRLGMERYHYWRLRESLPEMVVPTRYFMGLRYRRLPFPGVRRFSAKLTPMDTQILLIGKHLKEFATSGRQSDGLLGRYLPTYDFTFDGKSFAKVKKSLLRKIVADFRRLIRFTEQLALEEKRILDIHAENLIITIPEFELKVFDYHIFDEHLYDGAANFDRPERDHIEMIERFIESLQLE